MDTLFWTAVLDVLCRNEEADGFAVDYSQVKALLSKFETNPEALAEFIYDSGAFASDPATSTEE